MADLRSELLAIRAEHGKLTPHILVEVATAKDHPLHSQFDWDDSSAAHKYRLQQARQLIRVVREKYIDGDGKPADVRTFHAIPRAEGMVYEPLDQIVQDDIASKVLLASMEREWRSLKARFERFTEFREMILRDLGGEADKAA